LTNHASDQDHNLIAQLAQSSADPFGFPAAMRMMLAIPQAEKPSSLSVIALSGVVVQPSAPASGRLDPETRLTS